MKEKMNIILILTDDQGYWSLGSYGNRDVISSNLDRLAEEGVRFENFFCVLQQELQYLQEKFHHNMEYMIG